MLESTGGAAPSAAPEADLLRALQAALKQAGFYGGTVDGLDGPMTRQAIAAFAASRPDLSADTSLTSLLAAAETPLLTVPSPNASSDGSAVTPAPGAGGVDVEIVQAFIAGAVGGLEIDGVAGPDTTALARKALAGYDPDQVDTADPVAAIHALTTRPEFPYGTWRGTITCEGVVAPFEAVVIPNNTTPRAILSILDGTRRASMTFANFWPMDEDRLSISTIRPLRHPGDRPYYNFRGEMDRSAETVAGAFEAACQAFELTRERPVPGSAPAPAPPLTAEAPGIADPDSIAGDWFPASARMHRRMRGERPTGRFLPDVLYSIVPSEPGKVSMRLVSEGTREVLDERDFEVDTYREQLRMKMVRQSGTSRIEQSDTPRITHGYYTMLSERPGVDIMRALRGPFLVRFHHSAAEVEMGMAGISPRRFCTGPAAAIASAGLEISEEAAEIGIRFAAVVGGTSLPDAAMQGMFGDAAFIPAFGMPFDTLSPATRVELFSRLLTCALFANETPTRRGIEAAILQPMSSRSLIGELDLDASASASDRVRLAVQPGSAAIAVKTMRTAKSEAETRLAEASSDDPEAQAAVLRSMASRLHPSDFAALAGPVQAALIRARALAEEERQAALPPLPETELALDATQRALRSDCSGPLMQLIVDAMAEGNAGVLMWLTGKSDGGDCVINSGTHLLSYGIGSISDLDCDGGPIRSCRMRVRLSCDYGFNPDFGFDAGTADFDPGYCAALTFSRHPVRATFNVESHRRWTATSFSFAGRP